MQIYALGNVGLKTLISGRKKKMIKVSVIGFLEEINVSLYLAPVCWAEAKSQPVSQRGIDITICLT